MKNPQKYLGTKIVNAELMTRQAYNDLRGWTVPDDENPNDEGFLIEVIGGSKNTEQYDGYVQWLPTDSFDFEYRPIKDVEVAAVSALRDEEVEIKFVQSLLFDLMSKSGQPFNFGTAIEALKQGKKVARAGWNGKGMFLLLAHSIEFETKSNLECVSHLTGDLTVESIVMKTADDKFVVGWLASQTDMLAEDWQIVE